MSIELAGVALPSPVMVAAGCGGTGRELVPYADLAVLGGFVTRTLTQDPRDGSRSPRVVETPSGFVHATGLPNPGVDRFLTTELPWLAQQRARTFVSVAGATLGEYAELARRLGQSPGVVGVEVNVSVPDPKELGVFDAREPFQAARVVAAVRKELPRGILLTVKLAADPLRVVETARAASEAGADALVLVNSMPALLPDGRRGGLGGPAVRPVALRCLHDVRSALPEVPLVGVGGIGTAGDVRTFQAAGATAVQVGSALLHDPTTAARIAAELEGDQG